MKFGEEIESHQQQDPEWAPFYLDYSGLKSLLESVETSSEHHGDHHHGDQGSVGSSATTGALGLSGYTVSPKSEEFLRLLQHQVERLTLFVFDQTGQIASHVAKCRQDMEDEAANGVCVMGDKNTANPVHGELSIASESDVGQLIETDEIGSEILVPVASSSLEENVEANTVKDEKREEYYKNIQTRYFEQAYKLIRLYKFVEINVTGIRKILKKHDKVVVSGHHRRHILSSRFLGDSHSNHNNNTFLRRTRSFLPGASPTLPWTIESILESGNTLVKPLLNDNDALGALVVAIESGLFQVLQHKARLRDECQLNNTATPHPPGQSMQTSHRFNSRSYQHLATISSSHSHENRITSSQSSGALDGAAIMPIPNSNGDDEVDYLLFQLHAARRGLRQTSRVVRLLAAPLVLVSDDEEGNEQEAAVHHTQPPINRLSNLLNLLSTFFYMSSYYIVAPSSGNYAKRLGGNAALASLIVGMTPLAALVSTVLYSWWTSYSYKHALLFASVCSVVGNMLYALGLPFNSLPMVMVGRLLNGFGSARSINRRYIADTFPSEERTAASAAFVTAGALGMAAGPAVASLLQWCVSRFPSDNLYWQVENAPGVFMCVVWALYLMCMVMYFEDPPRKKHQASVSHLRGEEQPLLVEEGTTTSPLPVDPPIWKNIPVIMTLSIYFVLKLNLEAVLSAAGNVTEFYFGWGPSTVGLFLAGLGLLMLPANLLVAYLSRTHHYDDRDLILGLVAMMAIGCFMILHYFSTAYTETQYILASVVLFVSSTALEGPNMSLLSKTIPLSWRKGVFNVGFLATESGTLGRTVADILLAMFGRDGLDHLLNRTFTSFSVLAVSVLGMCVMLFDFLQPKEGDE